jgi:hypothetical protein
MRLLTVERPLSVSGRGNSQLVGHIARVMAASSWRWRCPIVGCTFVVAVPRSEI